MSKILQAEDLQRNSLPDLTKITTSFGLADLVEISPDFNEKINIPFINIYSCCELFYDTFLIHHMHRNVPCIIRGITSEWESSHKWVQDNKPNFEHLLVKFGESLVPVANCGDRYYNAQKKEEQRLKQFLDYWRSYISKNYPPELPCYYLKDWHFMRDFPHDDIYKVPIYFGSDWLNEYFIAREGAKDDYRFVYMGPKGSWTPLHADVFSSFSWSVNICGKKRWVLFPPGEEKCLTDKHGNLAYNIESPSLQDSSQYKDYHRLDRQYEVIQEAGDAIFVPSGWHHQVWNLEDTISINHNWVNGLNIDKMWASLRANLDAVKKEISDCQDMEEWEQHCQIMLNASFGLDLKQFCQFLLYIVGVRIEHLKKNEELKLFNNLTLDHNHMMLDILQTKKILVRVLSDPDFIRLNYNSEEREIRNVIKEIDIIINKE